jgi:hypothetical protein
LPDLLLHAMALAKERDVTFHTQDATASAALALAEDKWRKEDKGRQEEAAAKECWVGVNLLLFALAYSYE